jgi:hypothetical protein
MCGTNKICIVSCVITLFYNSLEHFYWFLFVDHIIIILFTAAGFYYTGKDREVRCFSCDASYCDWSYHSIPSEVHRRISPDCEYLNLRFPIDKTHILPNSTDDSQSSVEHCHTSHEIVYQSCKYNNIHLKINEVGLGCGMVVWGYWCVSRILMCLNLLVFQMDIRLYEHGSWSYGTAVCYSIFPLLKYMWKV